MCASKWHNQGMKMSVPLRPEELIPRGTRHDGKQQKIDMLTQKWERFVEAERIINILRANKVKLEQCRPTFEIWDELVNR